MGGDASDGNVDHRDVDHRDGGGEHPDERELSTLTLGLTRLTDGCGSLVP